jgi:2-phospho-L-lactate guanylyltransferase
MGRLTAMNSLLSDPPAPSSWRVVIPVKDARVGKSRLVATVEGADPQLRRAIAEDTIQAAVDALGPVGVVLVTSDPHLAHAWAPLGVTVLDDPGTGLNPAIAAGLVVAARPGSRTAALLGDLPALRPVDLALALEAASRHPQSFVPDQEGTGTVLRCGSGFLPRFGPHSAAAHERDGAVRLALDLPRLRTDVDDRSSLLRAAELGLGRRTLSALSALRLG